MANRESRLRGVAFLAFVLVLCAGPGVSRAGPKQTARALDAAAFETFGFNDGPAYLIVSVSSPTFEAPLIDRMTGGLMNNADELGSQVALIRFGTFFAGEDIPSTRFAGESPILVDLVDPETGVPFELDHHHATIVGSFRTLGDGTTHLMTPTTQAIPENVQIAYFNASRMFAEAQLVGELPPFPTTVELACFIYEHGGVPDVDVNDILTHVFYTDPIEPLHLQCASPCQAAGELFPHLPGEGLFNFNFRFDDTTGTLEIDVCLPISIDIKPGGTGPNSVNLTSEGVLPVGILTSDTFDAVAEIDRTTIRAAVFDEDGFEVEGASIPVEKTAVEDVDGDGDLDLIVHFRTQELVDVVLFEQTMSLRFRANTIDEGMCVEGFDSVRIVPPNK